MKTVRKQCEDALNMNAEGTMGWSNEKRIMVLEGLVLKLAQQIDNINNYGTFKG